MSKHITVNVSVNAIILFENKVLLLQMNRPEGKRGTWGLPGGKVENGESFEQALHREIKEETGIAPAQYTAEKITVIHPKPASSCKHIYKVTLHSAITSFTFDPTEIIQAQWLELNSTALSALPLRASWIAPVLLNCQKDNSMAQ